MKPVNFADEVMAAELAVVEVRQTLALVSQLCIEAGENLSLKSDELLSFTNVLRRHLALPERVLAAGLQPVREAS